MGRNDHSRHDRPGFAGLLVVDLHFPASQSLKDKRSPLRSVTTRLRNAGFSASEINGQDTWQRTQLAISIVTGGSGDTERKLDEAERICVSEVPDVTTRQRSVVSLEEFGR